MLTEIRMANKDRADLGVLSISMFSPGRYAVQFIDGLGPVKAEISTTDYAGSDGAYYQGRRVGPRNIVLTLDLLPSYSANEDAESLRRDLYKYVTPGTPLALTFVNHAGTQRLIDGVVESAEAPLFVQKPAVQVSIICVDPYFQAATDSLVVGNYSNTMDVPITNGGDIAVGFSSSVKVLAGGTELSLRTSPTDRIAITRTFVTNETMLLDTRQGRRSVGLTTGMSLLASVERGSTWPVLRPGPNTLRVSRGTGATGNNAVSVTFRERFAGL